MTGGQHMGAAAQRADDIELWQTDDGMVGIVLKNETELLHVSLKVDAARELADRLLAVAAEVETLNRALENFH